MYVKPSKNSPAALRKAAWEKAQAERNAQAHALLVASTVRLDIARTPECGE